MIQFDAPLIPRALLHPMEDLQAEDPVYDIENGGQWVSGEVVALPFEGCVLPLSKDDWRDAPQGTFTVHTRKIYTNGYKLRMGAQIRDRDGNVYTITGELGYDDISPIHRYIAERKGVAATK